MTTFELEEAVKAEARLDFSSPTPSVEGWKVEIGEYYSAMQDFKQMDPTEVFLCLSAFSARACEIRFLAMQSESRRGQVFRSQIVDPFIDACDFQFRLFSRIQAVRDMEFKMSGGQV